MRTHESNPLEGVRLDRVTGGTRWYDMPDTYEAPSNPFAVSLWQAATRSFSTTDPIPWTVSVDYQSRLDADQLRIGASATSSAA